MPFKSIITRPKYQLSKKKTPSFFSSSQCKRHSNDKLSSSNFSSGFKPKVPQHSQDIDCDVLFTSCDQTNAREIGNFKQAHRKQRKIEEIVGATKSDGYEKRITNRQQPQAAVEAEKKKLQTEEDKFGNRHTYQDHMPSKIWYKDLWRELKKQAKKVANSNADADSSSDESIHVGDFKQGHRKQGKIQAIVVATKSGGYERQIMNRQQSHATVETEKTKIQTKEDKLGNHHTYQDHMVNEKIWYKYLWRKWKKKAKQIANSNADADSSSYKSISDSDEKQTIFHKSQIKSIKTRATKRPSDSTRIKLEKIIAFDKKSTFPSSEGVKIESWGNVSYRKIVPATDVSSHLSSPKQGSVADLKLLGDIITTSEKTGEKPVEIGLNPFQCKAEENLFEIGLNPFQCKAEENLFEIGLNPFQCKAEENLFEIRLNPFQCKAEENLFEIRLNPFQCKAEENLFEVGLNPFQCKAEESLFEIGVNPFLYKAVEKLLENYKDYVIQYIYAYLAQTQTELKGKTNLVGLTTLQHKALENLLELKNAVAYYTRTFDSHGTRRLSDSTANNFEKLFVKFKENLAFQISKGVEVNHVSQKRDNNNKTEPSVQASMILESNFVYINPLILAVSSYPSIPNQNRNNEERCTTQGNEKENGDVAENHQGNGEHLVTSQNLDTPTTQDQIQDENSNNEERCTTQGNEKENGDVAENHQGNGEHLVTSQNLDTPTTQVQIQDENSNNEERCTTQGNEKENGDVAENHQGNGEHLVTSQNLDTPTTQVQIQDENSNNEERCTTQGNEKENGDVAENHQGNGEHLVTSQNLDTPTTQVQIQDENSNNEERCTTQGNEKENGDVAENHQGNGEHLVTSQNLDTPTTQVQIQDENSNNEERCTTQGNEKENGDVAENHQGNGEHLVTSQNLDTPTTQVQIQDENSNNEERCTTQGNEKESGDVAENHQGNGEHLVTSQTLDTPTIQVQIQDEVREATRLMIKQILSVLSDDCIHKSTPATDGSANHPIHHTDTCSHGHRTTLDSQEDNSTGMTGSMVNENWCKIQAEQISSSEANTDISSNESLSTVESTAIRLYRDVIRNETSRMMSSINRVVSEAVHLFGFERSQIFFDLLLDEELCQFESAGAISEFVPNMVESTVRQNVISFFELAQDMMNILMTLLLRCPDRNILQQMPVQDFTSLIKSVIKSSLKTKTKGREKLSLEGKIYTMVDSKDFERSLGEEIPEVFLNRLRSGDEMVAYRFVDTRLEIDKLSDRRDDRPIHSIYFPSDCRLFIYIPTENGSYWHQSDMRRADRIHQHSR